MTNLEGYVLLLQLFFSMQFDKESRDGLKIPYETEKYVGIIRNR
jgi:hypothetical protein